MTAARFVDLADRAISEIAARGRAVIICDGTGLYVRALLLGLFQGPPASPELRADVARQAEAGCGDRGRSRPGLVSRDVKTATWPPRRPVFAHIRPNPDAVP